MEVLAREIKNLQTDMQGIKELLVNLRRYPKQIQLENLRNQRYELIHPIFILLEEDDGQYAATWYDGDVFGYGASEQEAIDDFCETITAIWEVLKKESEIHGLSDALATQWHFLQKIIREVV
jgi:hypothetical protein